MRPTSCKETVFGEDGDGVEEEDHDYADRLAMTGWVIRRQGNTVDEVAEAKEQRHGECRNAGRLCRFRECGEDSGFLRPVGDRA
jgi:hypothetical protein